LAMKKSMTALDLAAHLRETWHLVEGSRVAGVRCAGGVVEVRLKRGGSRVSVIASPPRVFLVTRKGISSPASPSPLTSVLKKSLRGLRVISVSQLGLDRVVRLLFEGGRALVYEGVREGNLILTEGGAIIAALREREMRDRSIVRGVAYVPPPARGLDPLSLTEESLRNLLSGYKSKPVLPSICRLVNAPGEAVAEALHRAGIKPRDKVREVGDLGAFLASLREVYLEALRADGGYVARGEGRVVGVYPFEPTHAVEKGLRVERVDVFSEALEEYFLSVLSEVEGGEPPAVSRALEKALEYEEEAAKLRKAAETIFSSLAVFESLLEKAKRLKEEGRLDKIVEDPLVTGLDKSKARIAVRVGDIDVVFKVGESPSKVASKLYEEAKKLEKKARRAREIATELRERTKPAKQIVFRPVVEKAWYANFLHLLSSEGFLIVGGKDASQNEALVRKYMEPHDLFFHADVHGGPVVIVKTEGKKPGRATIEEAAQLAGVFSRAWEAGFHQVDVYWVYGEQVSKKAPSGEYLGKGAFMVYGKRNYLRVPLRLAVGMSVEEGLAKLRYGPPSAVSGRVLAYVELAPGRMERGFTAEKIRRFLVSAASRAGVRLKISRQEILNCLPKGGFYIVKTSMGEGYGA